MHTLTDNVDIQDMHCASTHLQKRRQEKFLCDGEWKSWDRKKNKATRAVQTVLCSGRLSDGNEVAVGGVLPLKRLHWKTGDNNTEYFFLMFTPLVQASSEKYVFQQQGFWPQKWNLFVRSHRRGMLVILGFCSACLDFPSWFCCQSKAVCRALAKGSFRNSD